MTALLSLLKNIQQHSQQLFECLRLEKQALETNQLDTLAEISSQKQVLLDQLDQLDKQRAAISCEKNFNTFIINSKDKILINQWKQTHKVITDCQQQNEINGRLINKRSQVNQDILSILSGRNMQTDETYNAKGNQSNNASLFTGLKA